ncbi:SDR family NAD(P)-dependent oxidoreductase [Methylobacterium oxalidis]|uniref:Oxidoreductase n=1 Tax=Methylobacterium oxalidis TaxID=944322 RepID=A0A512JCX4_9HYPH|nr:glucose 1-dehydrogenase [Methylobacterium oxalidis]GEP07814.1 oxidoreductase [Methylobacterium oxalidis]GJE34178.1 Glucose 1-dehydrogenase 1 [Methylobacterium oxalidis]GLS67553.1 oxidoreductase [Methylobacterium oxalidis]
MTKLQGKVAIVTGASKGIGAGIAKALAAEGAAVALNYASSVEDADRVVGEIGAGGGKAIAVRADIARASDVEQLFLTAKKELGVLDILVNNAGIYRFAPIDDFTESEFRLHFDLNVLALLLCTQQAVKNFGPNGGSVVNIGSAGTRVAIPTSAVYTATKAAVASITQVLSKELGPRNIRVNAISPGAVETEGLHAMGLVNSDAARDFVSKTPLGRMGQPQDVGSVAVFLASPDAGWITGEDILVSGGLR